MLLGGGVIAGLIAAGCAIAITTSAGPESQDAQVTSHMMANKPPAHDERRVASTGIGPASSGPDAPPPQMAGYVDFIVKFQDEPGVDAILRNFRRDRESAAAAFADWAAQEHGLSDFELIGATYSNEALLRFRFEDGVTPNRAIVDEILAELRRAPNIAYCDPDFTARPGIEGD